MINDTNKDDATSSGSLIYLCLYMIIQNLQKFKSQNRGFKTKKSFGKWFEKWNNIWIWTDFYKIGYIFKTKWDNK